MTAKEHNKLAGIFLMAHGAMQGIVMIILGLVYGVIGSAMLATGKKDEEQIMGAVFIGMVFLLFFISLLFLLPQVIGGWKMFKERPNARGWGIVGSIISLLSFPLGTAAGVYGLWFLFGEEGKRFYLGGQPQMYQVPPPPNSWQ